MRRKVISITLDPQDLKEVKSIARREDRSVSYLINVFIKEGLRRPEKTKRILQRDTRRRCANL
jgi:hypothetical protein